MYLFLERGEGREKERERNIDRPPLACSQLGTWPATPACALSGNRTVTLQFSGQCSIHTGHTSQGSLLIFIYHLWVWDCQFHVFAFPSLLLDKCDSFNSLVVRLLYSTIFWWFWMMIILYFSCNFCYSCVRRWAVFTYASILTGSPLFMIFSPSLWLFVCYENTVQHAQ